MPTVVWLPQASKDVDNHYNYLKTYSDSTAEKAAQAIVTAASSLEFNPYKGTIIQEEAGLRKLPVSFGKYGYVIHYAILGDEIVILRVYHGRQNRPY